MFFKGNRLSAGDYVGAGEGENMLARPDLRFAAMVRF